MNSYDLVSRFRLDGTAAQVNLNPLIIKDECTDLTPLGGQRVDQHYLVEHKSHELERQARCVPSNGTSA
ncbi:hypothetical protein GCM10007173_18950 [Glutamicibacter ardleyensis]|uniref:Uncharacterized protein n=1 Tax=Glutamicibacter ardleyensis TaxID=225894 RepID=A0ABQ2DNW4_9MICC|nr:hypothetical protein GCM10007173_18950 [Glutamicibacter ardleyensis]